MNARVASAALAACALISACSLGAVGSRGDERIDLDVVPVPSVVAGARFPWYSSDGQRILFSGMPDGSPRIELLSIREDGSDYRCLTCGTAPEVTEPLLKPIPFRDNRRVLVRVGEQSPVKAADHAIVECRPTVTNCTHAELVPIVIPSAGNAVVLQDQREFRVAPDGMHVGFTQVRATATGHGSFAAAVASLVRTPAGYELRDARVVSTRGELKDFTPDAKAVLVAAFTTSPYEAANPDVLRIDLRSGRESRVTSDPDYDEDLKFSPDGHWYVVGSGRTAGLFETVSQLKRPNFIGSGIEPLTAALFVQHRAEVIEPWLVRAGAERFGARGRLLNPESPSQGYDGRAIMSWHPDGTRIIFWEGSSDPSVPPDRATRIVVAHLVDRAPTPSRPSRTSPNPTWAPVLDGFVPPDPALPQSRDGLRGGSVVVTERPGTGDRTILEVAYRGFSDARGWVLDGIERADFRGGLTGQTIYTANLRLSGRHRGFLEADATISAAGIIGSIDSEVDGRHLHLP